jgi:hypothetical protein
MTAATTAYRRLLDRLRADGKLVRQDKPNHAMAQCPAHEDGNPSLSITDVGGEILLHCFAGCTNTDIAAALGWQLGELLYDDPKGTSYTYPDGRTEYKSYDANGKKRFRQSGTGNKATTLHKAAEVKATIARGEPVYVCEGGKDVRALESLGAVATTAPQGAGNWDKVDPSPLYGGQIIAIVDKDEGGQKWMGQVKASLNGSTKSLSFVQAKVGKDAADHVAACLGLADFEPVIDPLLAGIRNGAWLDGQIFDPLHWVVPGLLPEGLSLLVGAPKTGKSWLALAIALAVASGGHAFGRIAVGEARPVLLLALEDSDRRMQDRIRTLLPRQPIPDKLDYLTRLQPGTAVATIEAWLSALPARCGAPLVLVDTIGKITPNAASGETTYQRDYRIANRLQQVCDLKRGTSLTGLHHDRKAGSDDFVDKVSGTNGLAGAADTIIVLNRPRNETQGLLKVTGRDVRENEYGVEITDGGWTLIGESLVAAARAAETIRATAHLGDLMSAVLQYVLDHPNGVRAGDVATGVGMNEHGARTYLTRLADAGKIDRLARGLYTPPVQLRVATVANDTEITHATPEEYLETSPNATHATRNSTRGDDLNAFLGGQEGRCPACGYHTTQGHDANCTERPTP